MTSFNIDYDRQFKDHEVNQIVNRATDTVAVLAELVNQIGPEYETLPGYAKADYQAAVDALNAKQAAVNALLAQFPGLLHDLDDLTEPLNQLNQGCLSALRGLLMGKPQDSLLDQIDKS